MPQLIPVEVEGSTILIEAVVLGGEEEIAGAGKPSFAVVWQSVTKVARELATSLNQVKPDRATIEFGCQFAIESGQLTALLVSGSATGSIKVTLEWVK